MSALSGSTYTNIGKSREAECGPCTNKVNKVLKLLIFKVETYIIYLK